MEDNELLLDWKATTGFGTATFDELAAGRGDPVRNPRDHRAIRLLLAGFSRVGVSKLSTDRAGRGTGRSGATPAGAIPPTQLVKDFSWTAGILQSSNEPAKGDAAPGTRARRSLAEPMAGRGLLHKEWITPESINQ